MKNVLVLYFSAPCFHLYKYYYSLVINGFNDKTYKTGMKAQCGELYQTQKDEYDMCLLIYGYEL